VTAADVPVVVVVPVAVLAAVAVRAAPVAIGPQATAARANPQGRWLS
jgi:hypothetical protein